MNVKMFLGFSRSTMALHRRNVAYYGAAHTGNFEQTLDIYTPVKPEADAPLVVLVVGSAWLGHSQLIVRLLSPPPPRLLMF